MATLRPLSFVTFFGIIHINRRGRRRRTDLTLSGDSFKKKLITIAVVTNFVAMKKKKVGERRRKASRHIVSGSCP